MSISEANNEIVSSFEIDCLNFSIVGNCHSNGNEKKAQNTKIDDKLRRN